jgi:hypothetical protein
MMKEKEKEMEKLDKVDLNNSLFLVINKDDLKEFATKRKTGEFAQRRKSEG